MLPRVIPAASPFGEVSEVRVTSLPPIRTLIVDRSTSEIATDLRRNTDSGQIVIGVGMGLGGAEHLGELGPLSDALGGASFVATRDVHRRGLAAAPGTGGADRSCNLTSPLYRNRSSRGVRAHGRTSPRGNHRRDKLEGESAGVQTMRCRNRGRVADGGSAARRRAPKVASLTGLVVVRSGPAIKF